LSAEKDPRLLEAEEAAAKAAAEPVVLDDTTEVVVPDPEPVTTPEPVVESTPPVAEDETQFIKISRASLHQDLRRLIDEDADLRNAVNTYGGRKAKREWEAKLREIEVERDAVRLELEKRQIKEMDPEEVERRFRDEPAFARKYAETIHAQAPDVAVIREAQGWIDAAEDVFESAEAVLPAGRLDQYRVALGMQPQTQEGLRFVSCPVHQTNDHGFFDHDDAGVMLTPQRAFARFQSALGSDTLKARQSAAPRPQPAPVAQVAPAPAALVATAIAPAPARANPRLAEASPDLSAGSSVGSKTKINLSEVRRMSPPERLARWPDGDAFQAAVQAGLIVVDV
jgi:hypothetical protein